MKKFRLWLIPELLRLSNEDQRWMVFRYCVSGGWMPWWQTGCIVIPACLSFFSPLGKVPTWTHNGRWGDWIYLALWMIGSALFAFAWMGLGFRVLRPHIRRRARLYLRRRLDMEICVQCDYDLTGNTSGVCPECGAAGAAPYEAWRME